MSKNFMIRKVAVLGAGVMGARIAAHMVNASVETLLFDLPDEEGDPNGKVVRALEGLKKAEPGPLSSPGRLGSIQPANYGQHLERLRECDLVIEAIAERMDWKTDLYRTVVPWLGEECIFASNTSGLSINGLAQTFPENLRQRFCGIHFFNPPRYMHLVELIPCTETLPERMDHLEEFLVSTLGKGVVRARDTPGFIANRIGMFSLLSTLHHAQRMALNFDTVDALTGSDLGRPKSATFRTLDVVGLDVFASVADTMRMHLPGDPWHSCFDVPDWLGRLVKEGALGQKTGRGVYQKLGNQIYVFDPGLQNYRLSEGKVDAALKETLRQRDWAKKMEALRSDQSKQAQFLWAVFRDLFHYCAVHMDEIADSARDLDFAMRWGFGWSHGPLEIWQAAGWQKIAGWLNEDISAGKTLSPSPLPGWVTDPARRGVHEVQGSYSSGSNRYQPRSTLSVYRRQLFPDRLLGEAEEYGETIFDTNAARMWHNGQDIAVLSFKTKMHTISSELLDDMLRALDEAEENWRALIIWQTDRPFSAGADLLKLMQGVQTAGDQPADGFAGRFKGALQRVKYTVAGGGGLGEIVNAAVGNVLRVEDVIARFQQVSQRLKYAQIPTVAAIDGLALGGGCELSIHCTRVVATMESYIGLVETGVGLLPSGGGCKEMAQRAAAEARGGDIFPHLCRYFQNIAMGEVSKSAELAREMGYLRASDRIVMNRFELLHVAIQEAMVLSATVYRPPLIPRQIPVAGRGGIASLKAAMVNMLQGGFISEHDYAVGCRVAEVMCGGDVDTGSQVDEQWLLDLERRNFLDLLAMSKTQERIEYMLRNSKPLRN